MPSSFLNDCSENEIGEEGGEVEAEGTQEARELKVVHLYKL